MPQVPCPDDHQLSRLLRGDLDQDLLDDLMIHVDLCTACQQRVEELERAGDGVSDPLTTQLQQLKGRAISPAYPSAPRSSQRPIALLDSESETDRASLPSIPGKIGPYRVDGLIGVGGMGSLYQVTHQDLGRTLALKMIWSRPDRQESLQKRFRREWNLHGRLVHPNIVQATDAGVVGGHPYLVTELVDGCDLRRLVRTMGPMGVRLACELVRQAALGLDHAHERGLFHRDVKPSNLMLGRDGVVKVVDLGLAAWRDDDSSQSSDSELTVAGQLLGTVDFMSPEQIESPGSVSTASDVYSLGCTLFFLLTGKPPFSSPEYQSLRQVMNAHLNADPPRLKDALPKSIEQNEPDTTTKDLEDVQAVLDQMLAKETLQRTQSMNEVAQMLAPLATDHDWENVLPKIPELVCQPLPASEPESPSRTRTAIAWTSMALAALMGIIALSWPADPAVKTGPNAEELESGLKRSSVWAAAPRDSNLHGLVPLPASLPGIKSWQVDTIAPFGSVRSLRWSPSGKLIAVTSHDGRLRIYRYNNKELSLDRIAGTVDMDLWDLGWTNDSASVVVKDGDRSIRVFNLQQSAFVSQINLEPSTKIRCPRVHPSESKVAFTAGGIVYLWTLNDSAPIVMPALRAEVLAWDLSGDHLAIVDPEQEQIRIHAVTDAGIDSQPIRVGEFKRSYPPLDLGYNGTGTKLCVVGPRKAERFDVETLESIEVTRTGRFSIVPRPGSEQSAVGVSAGIELIDGDAERIADRRLPGMQGFIPAVDWDPDGERLAFGGIGSVFVTDTNLNNVASLGGVTAMVGAQFAEASRSICVGATRNELAHFSVAGKLVATDRRQQTGHRMMLRFEINQATLGGVVWSVGDSINRQRFAIPLPSDQSTEAVPDRGQIWLEYNPDTRSMSGVTFRPSGSTTFQPVVEDNKNKMGLALSPNESQFVMMGYLGGTQVRSANNGTLKAEYLVPMDGRPRSAIWPREESLIVSMSGKEVWSTICIDPSDGSKRWSTNDPQAQRATSDSIHSLIALDDESLLASAPSGFVVREFESGDLVRRTETRKTLGFVPESLGRSYDGDFVFSSSVRPRGGRLVSWDPASLQPRWQAIVLGKQDWITMSASGQIIDGTAGAASQLVWIVKQQDGRKVLMDYQSFLDLVDSNQQ